MVKPPPFELRRRVVEHVETGNMDTMSDRGQKRGITLNKQLAFLAEEKQLTVNHSSIVSLA